MSKIYYLAGLIFFIVGGEKCAFPCAKGTCLLIPFSMMLTFRPLATPPPPNSHKKQNLIRLCKSLENAVQLMNGCNLLLILSPMQTRKYSVTAYKLVMIWILSCDRPWKWHWLHLIPNYLIFPVWKQNSLAWIPSLNYLATACVLSLVPGLVYLSSIVFTSAFHSTFSSFFS